ncbi:SDR family NAD(P)-dependent oxidoreductase [Cupriavidus oxalaticus]|jgi:NAD(P)-dependent dehydrogenase (short-subunit alcohol dehydrogenase family)|uniref:SDR family NAD(P)-dependent oxidoreductase n=1 Tax=Cupriavidus oxalaticus TaxID=96344 RepID=A0A375GHI2_9BURK|nr:SDR family NAD(P)-dependent oxidoreductase [Cupriavidus oxalaticus]QEZ43982.1 SDR family NAD(P)-dependent oxidoreductase [Cupriavidus oxalaticus]QRQ84611.1 SDR family NAD(P)-dependent oxidoreductase [Cupriavidus oxalaticus]QRQ91300.1 SDR family NAD(P)-dependent oxidoreductase [Cupriavidus oxalaticus]WQD85857.1 SDR family NAD(P)-dependent oxidoreductase [Cupriavidus oxalaticus]SPC19959.1 putative short-chain dehydrogenases/reductase (SDR) family protein [Cupriavidus oxalaticus]
MNFNGKNVLVTGARGNLGRAVAHAFAQAGARVVLLDRHDAPLPEVGSGHLALQADLLDADSLGKAIGAAVQACGRIDVVCNLAGGFAMGTGIHETSAADWNRLFDMNVGTVLNMARAVVPHMLAAGGGAIVNVGANSAARGLAQMGAYCASKDALARVTESMSAELRDQGIRVNAVLPSILDTPENRQAMPDADTSRWVGLDAMADVILFLASDAARAVQGALVPVVNRA